MKKTMTINYATVTANATVTARTRAIACPANILNIDMFKAQVENAIYARVIDMCGHMSAQWLDKAETTKNMDTEKNARDMSARFDAAYATVKAMYHNDIPDYKHTIAHVVAYTLFPAMRGSKSDIRVFSGFFDAYHMAQDIARGSMSDKAVAPLATALREAMNTAITNDGNNDNISKRFKARVNNDMARNLIHGAGFVRTSTISRNGQNTHVMTAQEFTVQAMNMCLLKTFDYTDIKGLKRGPIVTEI